MPFFVLRKLHLFKVYKFIYLYKTHSLPETLPEMAL